MEARHRGKVRSWCSMILGDDSHEAHQVHVKYSIGRRLQSVAGMRLGSSSFMGATIDILVFLARTVLLLLQPSVIYAALAFLNLTWSPGSQWYHRYYSLRRIGSKSSGHGRPADCLKVSPLLTAFRSIDPNKAGACMHPVGSQP